MVGRSGVGKALILLRFIDFLKIFTFLEFFMFFMLLIGEILASFVRLNFLRGYYFVSGWGNEVVLVPTSAFLELLHLIHIMLTFDIVCL